MDELNQIIGEASAAIEDRYFRLPLNGGGPVYRERVYCYELYHQMRCQWPPDCQFTLNGEVDKRAHPIIQNFGVANTIPDFLVHVPGNMENNHAVIEVKSCEPSSQAIRVDLQKLNAFQVEVGYQRGIYLVYGGSAAADVRRIDAVARQLNLRGTFELWIHTASGEAVMRVI
jgi:hypothetical protein